MQSIERIQDITRPPRHLCDALAAIGTATASSELSLMGIRDPHVRGLQPLVTGKSVAGPALTLQCMPKREDLYGANEYDNPELQLHRHVLYPAEAGDMVVVDARGDMGSGIFGEMMLTFFKGRGGAGVVVDGCIRDSGPAKTLDLGIWVKGVTPNYHAQTNIIVADDDGVVCVPVALAPRLIELCSEHVEWEEFARLRLSEGGDLRKYYPLSDEARPEYEAWRKLHPLK